MNRVSHSILEVLIWIDKGVCLIITIPFYLVIGEPIPKSDKLISHVVGHYAKKGLTWALILEWIIDRLFYVFEGYSLGHCQKYNNDPKTS